MTLDELVSANILETPQRQSTNDFDLAMRLYIHRDFDELRYSTTHDGWVIDVITKTGYVAYEIDLSTIKNREHLVEVIRVVCSLGG